VFENAVFPQNGGGGSRKHQMDSLSTLPSNKPQDAPRRLQIRVGGYLAYLAPITLSHNQYPKYPDSPIATMSAYADKHRGVYNYQPMNDVVEEASSSEDEVVIGFFDMEAVHLAPSRLMYHSITKHPRRMT